MLVKALWPYSNHLSLRFMNSGSASELTTLNLGPRCQPVSSARPSDSFDHSDKGRVRTHPRHGLSDGDMTSAKHSAQEQEAAANHHAAVRIHSSLWTGRRVRFTPPRSAAQYRCPASLPPRAATSPAPRKFPPLSSHRTPRPRPTGGSSSARSRRRPSCRGH